MYGAGGKTTLARALASKLSLAHIETDAIHHMPDWRSRPFEDTLSIVTERISASTDGWIIDGNYAALRPHVLPSVDTAIVIQLPFAVLFWRILVRTVTRAWSRRPIHGGNRESFKLAFASRDSILCEVWRRRGEFASLGETIGKELPGGVQLLVLRSARELDQFYVCHGLKRQ